MKQQRWIIDNYYIDNNLASWPAVKPSQGMPQGGKVMITKCRGTVGGRSWLSDGHTQMCNYLCWRLDWGSPDPTLTPTLREIYPLKCGNVTQLFLFLQLVWLGMNVFLFIRFYRFYDIEPQYHYTRKLLGVSMSWISCNIDRLTFLIKDSGSYSFQHFK